MNREKGGMERGRGVLLERRLDGADGGRASAGWTGAENEVEVRLLREEIPMWIWKAAAGDGAHLLDFRVCPKRLGVEYKYITG